MLEIEYQLTDPKGGWDLYLEQDGVEKKWENDLAGAGAWQLNLPFTLGEENILSVWDDDPWLDTRLHTFRFTVPIDSRMGISLSRDESGKLFRDVHEVASLDIGSITLVYRVYYK